VTPSLSSVHDALNPHKAESQLKQWWGTWKEVQSAYEQVQMVGKFGGLGGGLAQSQIVTEEGLTMTIDYCPSPEPTGFDALVDNVKALTNIKAWEQIDPCLVGTWLMAGPLRNTDDHPIATGATTLTISRAGFAVLNYDETKFPLPVVQGQELIGVGSVLGSASLTVAAPLATSGLLHRLIWGVVGDSVFETDQGWIINGEPGYVITDVEPPIEVPPVPDSVTPPFTELIPPNGVLQTSYECNSDHGTLTLKLPFGSFAGKTIDTLFKRVGPADKPAQ
jgi:hypothetical protein